MELYPRIGVPSRVIEISWVVPLRRSRRKMLVSPLVSSPTRFEASELNATNRPSGEMASDSPLNPLAWRSFVLIETRRVLPVNRSRTKTSKEWLVSLGTRFEAIESKATYRPSAETAGPKLFQSPWPSFRLSTPGVCHPWPSCAQRCHLTRWYRHEPGLLPTMRMPRPGRRRRWRDSHCSRRLGCRRSRRRHVWSCL